MVFLFQSPMVKLEIEGVQRCFRLMKRNINPPGALSCRIFPKILIRIYVQISEIIPCYRCCLPIPAPCDLRYYAIRARTYSLTVTYDDDDDDDNYDNHGPGVRCEFAIVLVLTAGA